MRNVFAIFFEWTLVLGGLTYAIVVACCVALSPIALCIYYKDDPAMLTAMSCASAAVCLVIAGYKTRKKFTEFLFPMILSVFAGGIIVFNIIRLWLVGILR